MDRKKRVPGAPCALCKRPVPLCRSHLLPSFVLRWFKQTSATGHLRLSDTPNRRAQDGPKSTWLCPDCEEVLNRFETPFAKRIFHPWNLDDSRRLPYGDWMLKFCVSLSWRTWKYFELLNGNQDMSVEERAWGEAACARWEAFLKGEVPHPGEFEQHLLPLAPITSHTTPRLPSNANRYLLRALAMDVVWSDKDGFTYTKFGRFALFGFLRRPADKWQGTKVHVRDGSIGSRSYGIPGHVGSYIVQKMDQYREITKSMTETQHDKVETTVLADIERFARSDTFAAMQHDERLFGESALIRDSKTRD